MDIEKLYEEKERIETTYTCPYKLDCTKCKELCEGMKLYMANQNAIKEIESKPGKRWVIADTHFFHDNIIRYCNRPFKNSKEMNNKLIKNWNSQVKDNDIVYLLGDFALKHKEKEKMRQILSMLKGRKVLVMGNHDNKKPAYYLEVGFLQAVRKPILYQYNVILMHEPPKKNEIIKGMHYIFGHVHDKVCEADHEHNCFCVSAERTNYFLLNLDALIAYLTKQGVEAYDLVTIEMIKNIKSAAIKHPITVKKNKEE